MGNLLFLSSCCWECGLISSCIRKLGVHLMLQQGSWGSSQVARGESGFLLSCNRELLVLLELWGELGVHLELWQETRGSS